MRNHGSTTSTNGDGFRRIELITGVGRRRRWTDEEKAWIVAESLDPATTVSAVARRYGLHASPLFVWRQQLAAPAAHEAPAFVPVVVAESGGAAPAEMAGRMEIALGPAVVRVGADVDAGALRPSLKQINIDKLDGMRSHQSGSYSFEKRILYLRWCIALLVRKKY